MIKKIEKKKQTKTTKRKHLANKYNYLCSSGAEDFN